MEDKIIAGIMGICVGDALGVPVEFKRRESLANHPVTDMRGYGTYNQPPGSWSDDTSMTLCLMDSLTEGLDYEEIMKKFMEWIHFGKYTPHGRLFDIGMATKRALDRYYDGVAPLSCGGILESENGNGSLMRILPLAFYLRSRYGSRYTDNLEAYDIIHDVSSLTHAHKRSLVACGIYMSIVERLLDGVDLKEGIRWGIGKARSVYEENSEYASELHYFERLFEDRFADLPQDLINSTGYVLDTLEAAIWCLLNTGSYEECVLKAVNLGEDTDTVAAVAGGLAGLYYGYDAIPQKWVDQIVRADYIKELCGRFAASLSDKD
ncbi:MAG: ADP-ribosylglycohydrolase family protein [Methanomassiliicoccaceae archaeon]|nr:ADP-ribosylglycohydrolase family protein [Methanomassiliicoccaceae archaeon]